MDQEGNNIMLDGTHFFECRCGSSEHTLRFTLDKGPDDPGIYTSIFLNDWKSFWKRLIMGIKYIFGYKSRCGHWDCWLMKRGDVERLKDMCDEFIKTNLETN